MVMYTDGLADSEEEIGAWLERIDSRLADIGVSNVNVDASPIRSTAPQVTGLYLVPNLNTITVTWSPVDMRNLDFYEIQVSPTPAFEIPTIHRQRSIKFTYQEGSPGETYYVRVRAKPVDGGYGSWSGTLSTDTGIATVTHLDRGAATVVSDNYFDLSGEDALDPYETHGAGDNSVTATWGGTQIRSLGGTVLPFITFKYAVATDWDEAAASPHNECKSYIEVLRSGAGGEVTVDDVYVSSYSVFGLYNVGDPPSSTVARLPTLALGSPDDPGYGAWRYRVRMTVYGDSSGAAPSYIRVEPGELSIKLLELRN